jgi:hypothetical protein
MAFKVARPQSSRTSCRFANPLPGATPEARQSRFLGVPRKALIAVNVGTYFQLLPDCAAAEPPYALPPQNSGFPYCSLRKSSHSRTRSGRCLAPANTA